MDLRWFPLGLQGYLDTKMLVLVKQNACIGVLDQCVGVLDQPIQGLDQRKSPMRMGSRSGGISNQSGPFPL